MGINNCHFNIVLICTSLQYLQIKRLAKKFHKIRYLGKNTIYVVIIHGLSLVYRGECCIRRLQMIPLVVCDCGCLDH